MSTADIVIAGAGIIGLSTALELAEKGLRVTVLERQRAMSEASWAAAGMLAAEDPENPPQLRPLSDLSIALYPDFLRNIQRLSGVQVPLRTIGTLQGSELNGSLSSPLSSDEITDRIPGLITANRQFTWLNEHSIDPRDLCIALPKAAVAVGVHIVEESPVREVRTTSQGIEVTALDTIFSGTHFINCCGAWAWDMWAEKFVKHPDSEPVLYPVKGQMVTVKLPSHLQLDCVIRTPELYLVPRGDGRIAIGASVERAGFDKSVQETTIQALLEEASELWPSIREGQLVETWAGLRPGSADGLPMIGSLDEKNCWIASGHFRNGILLAPATARVLCELILGQEQSVELTPFRSDRLGIFVESSAG